MPITEPCAPPIEFKSYQRHVEHQAKIDVAHTLSKVWQIAGSAAYILNAEVDYGKTWWRNSICLYTAHLLIYSTCFSKLMLSYISL